MRRADVVIGAQYGDEGKGLLVDRLVAESGAGALVVRFNGGAQAGHTVRTPEGLRHVHSHFGAGTPLGAPTFLSRRFVASPLHHAREAAVLSALGLSPTLLVDARAPVTTPYDMMLNRAAEAARGRARHGSVGAGFGETLERGLDPAHALTVADLADADRLVDRLRAIRDRWVPARAAILGLPAGAVPEAAGEALVERFAQDAAAFLAAVEVVGPGFLAGWRGATVFEGAQGLLLDQDRGAFPHVTRSNTGLRNALELAAEAGIGRLDAVYATRAYVTRHGAGPLAHETPAAPYAGVSDPTNVPNPHQGSLRFGWLDLPALGRAVRDDLSDARGAGVDVRHRVAVTCLDQVGAAARLADGSHVRPDDLPALAARACGAGGALGSWGPTRDHVRGAGPARLAA